MFEIEWKKEKSVYRNLLKIKGISKTFATIVTALLGISKDTKYGELDQEKQEELNLCFANYKKKTAPFSIMNFAKNSLTQELNKLKRSESSELEKVQPDWVHLSNYSPNSINLVEQELTKDRIATPILSSLDAFNSANIKMLINSGTLRGKRIKLGYPVRGQRTRSNGKTAKRLNRGLDY